MKWVKVAQSCLTLWDPMEYRVHGILQARILEWVAFPFSGKLPNPGIEPRSPALQTGSLPAEPQGKPKNTGVRSLSLPHGIFLTQELNRGLVHCRRILNQLSYHRSPKYYIKVSYFPSGISKNYFSFPFLFSPFSHLMASCIFVKQGLKNHQKSTETISYFWTTLLRFWKIAWGNQLPIVWLFLMSECSTKKILFV